MGERRLGAAKSLSFELLLLYDVNATEARNYENVYQKLSIIPNSSKLNTIQQEEKGINKYIKMGHNVRKGHKSSSS